MNKFLRSMTLAATAAALTFTVSAAAAPVSVSNGPVQAHAAIVKPLTLTKMSDLDFGTIVVQDNGTAVMDTAGALTCPAPLTCATTGTPAPYKVTGTNNQVVQVTAPNVTPYPGTFGSTPTADLSRAVSIARSINARPASDSRSQSAPIAAQTSSLGSSRSSFDASRSSSSGIRSRRPPARRRHLPGQAGRKRSRPVQARRARGRYRAARRRTAPRHLAGARASWSGPGRRTRPPRSLIRAPVTSICDPSAGSCAFRLFLLPRSAPRIPLT